MNTEPTTSKKKDLLLIAVILLIAAALWAGHQLKQRTPAPQDGGAANEADLDPSSPAEDPSPGQEELPLLRAEVTIDGQVKAVLDLAEDQEVTIESITGGTNHLVIQDGEIWCDDASCPDRVCIHQGHQSMDGDIIVCLPNLMIVQVIERETDAQ